MGNSRANEYRIERAIKEAEFIVTNRATVRDAAKEFKVSKSTVHADCSKLLKEFGSIELYNKVRARLELNKEERAVRGGLATKMKYKRLLSNKEEFNADLDTINISEEELNKYWFKWRS